MENQPLKEVMQGIQSCRIPRWFMRQAGRYLPEYREIRAKFDHFTELIFSVPEVVEVTLQPLNRYDLDAAIIFSDILVVPMMLGTKVEVLENFGPKLSVLSHPDHIDRLELNEEICSPMYEAMDKVRSKLDKNKSLIGFAGAPWTVASYMLEGKTSKTFSITKAFAYQWPNEFEKLLNIISDATANHLIAQINAGADVVKLFDSWAGAVPCHKIHDWVHNPQRRIMERVASVHPKTPFIIFAKGAENYYESYPKTTNLGCFALGPTADLSSIAKTLPQDIALQGALDPSLLVVGGNPMIKEIETQYEIFRKRPYIFNLGHGILPETPPQNVQLALDTLDRISA